MAMASGIRSTAYVGTHIVRMKSTPYRVLYARCLYVLCTMYLRSTTEYCVLPSIWRAKQVQISRLKCSALARLCTLLYSVLCLNISFHMGKLRIRCTAERLTG